MNELSIETQRRLTEALGEHWCEQSTLVAVRDHDDWADWWCECGKCHGQVDWNDGYKLDAKIERLDFTDGRVTVRLMELVCGVSVVKHADGFSATCFDDAIEGLFSGSASTRQIAIAKAVDALLVAQKGA